MSCTCLLDGLHPGIVGYGSIKPKLDGWVGGGGWHGTVNVRQVLIFAGRGGGVEPYISLSRSVGRCRAAVTRALKAVLNYASRYDVGGIGA